MSTRGQFFARLWVLAVGAKLLEQFHSEMDLLVAIDDVVQGA